MEYTPPLDLLVLLDFAPACYGYWRHNLTETEYVQVCASVITGISIISYNTVFLDELAQGVALYKDTVFCGFLRDEQHFRQVIADAGWAA